MNSLILLGLLLSIAYFVSGSPIANNGGVIRVKAQHHQLSEEQMADRNKHPLRKARMERMKAQELDANSGQTSPIPLAYNTTWLLIGNITIGTPPQTLQVAFDLYEEDLYVTDVNAVLYNPWTSSSSSAENTPVVPRFDSSASTTYLATNQNFSEWGHISGKFASDIVNLGGLDVNLTFGDANQIAYYIDTLPIAGFFGL